MTETTMVFEVHSLNISQTVLLVKPLYAYKEQKIFSIFSIKFAEVSPSMQKIKAFDN